MKNTLLHPVGAFAASVILLLAFSVPARPQAITASLTGILEDSSKAVIPGVIVTMTNPKTGVSHQAVTDNSGRYLIPELAPGTYDIVAGVAGFKSASRKGVAVNVGAKMEINFVLEIGDLSETVMITGGAPLVDTRQGSLSAMVEEKKILDLPLNGRNPYDLIALQPGIDSGDGGAGRGPSSNGMRGASSNYMLDGADNNNQTTATSVNTKVPLDAVQEFRVITNSYASEYGRNGGFVANVVTKSGTNGVHGSFWDYLRNDKLDANSFNSNLSGLPRDPYKRNQFGGTIGGPLVKDKVFYFGSVESTLARSAFSGAFRYPTPEYIASIPGPVARQLLTKYKPPVPTRNFVDSFSGFTLGPNLRGVPGRDGINESGIADVPLPTRFNGNQVMFKADANLNGGKDMISGRYSFDDGDQTSPLATGYEGFGNQSTYVSRGQNAVLNHIRVFSNNLVNEFRTGYNRYNSAYLRPDPTIPSLIFVSPATGFATPGAIAGFPQDFTENTFQWLDNLIWTRGSHSMKIGFEYRRTRNGSVFANFRDGEFRFRDSIAFGNDVPDRFSISVDPRTTPLTYPDYYRGYRGNEYYFFFQDDWKVNRKLTLNLGARYEYFGVPHNFRQELDSNFYFGPGATMAERIATADFRLTSDNPGDLKNLVWRKDYNNWAPRLGFAYDLMGDGKTSIRGGYGVFYERLFNNVFENIRFNLPVYANTQFFNLPGAAAEFTYGYPALSVLPQQLRRVPPVSPRHMDENLRTAYSHNWFVGVERQILTHTVVELNYVGTAAFKLSATNNINRFQENGLRFNTRIANDNYRANLANSHYNSLQLGVRQRYNKGFSYQGSYTWAHAIDQLSDTLPITNSNPDLGFREAFNPRGDYGSADFDRRHRFILNASWELPWMRAQQGFLRQAFGGWTLNGIYTVQSGYPFTISDFNDPNGDGNFQDRAQLVSGQNLSNALNTGKRPPVEGGVQLIRSGFFMPVPEGTTLGNLGRNYLHAAGDQNYDFSVFKTFKTPWWNGETGNIQLRFEFFNLFNHPKLDLPDNDVDSGTFGQAFYGADTTGNLTGSNAFRIIQVALKFSF